MPLIDQPLPAVDSAAEAGVLAAATSQPVMVNDETTADTAAFVMPDGSRVAELSGGPVRVPDPSDPGAWVDVDMTLVDDGAAVHARFSPTPITLSDGGSDGFVAKLGIGADQFTMSWLSALPAPILDGNRARYVDAVAGGVDLIVEARPSGFELYYEIPSAPAAPLVLRIPLALRGVTATITAEDQLELRDVVKGELEAESAPALVWGATRNPGTDEPVDSASLDLQVTHDASAQVWLEAHPDPAFFARPGLTYPVTIDPAVDLNGQVDTFIRPDAPTADYNHLTELQVGTPTNTTNTYRRTLMAFTLTPILGQQILNDTFLDIWQFLGSCSNANPVELWGTNGASVLNSTNWNSRPGLVGNYASASAPIGCTGHSPGRELVSTSMVLAVF